MVNAKGNDCRGDWQPGGCSAVAFNTKNSERGSEPHIDGTKIGARNSPEAGRGADRTQYPGHILADPRDRLVPGEQPEPVEFRQQSAVGEREA